MKGILCHISDRSLCDQFWQGLADESVIMINACMLLTFLHPFGVNTLIHADTVSTTGPRDTARPKSTGIVFANILQLAKM